MGTTQRLAWVDIAKGVSIVFVVIYHATLMVTAVGIDVELLSKASEALKPVRMPLFFLASGFFARSSITASWPDIWRRRILFLLYLFAVWTVIRWFFFSVVPNPWTPEEGTDVMQIATAFLVPQTGLWFLWELAWFYLLTKAVSRLPVFWVALVASLASIVSSMHLVSLPFAYENFLKYFVFFYAACHYREVISGLLVLRALPTLLATGSMFIALVGAVYLVENSLVDGVGHFAAAICGVAGLVVASDLVKANALGAILAYLGRHTLEIYLAHVPLVALMAHVFVEASAADLGAATIALPLLAGAAAIVICLGLERAARSVGACWLYQLPRLPAAPTFGAGSGRDRAIAKAARSEPVGSPPVAKGGGTAL